MSSREIATGYAGTSVARQESALDALTRIRNQSTALGMVTPSPIADPRGGWDYPNSVNPGLTQALNPYSGTIFDSNLGFNPGATTPTMLRDYQTYNQNLQSSGVTVPSLGPAPFTYVGDDQDDKGAYYEQLDRAAAERSNRASQSEVLKSALQRYTQSQWEPFGNQISDVRGQYGELIATLRDELAGYGSGLTDVNAAYARYQQNAGDILEGAVVDAPPLPDSGVEAVVHGIYDEYDGATQSALQQIDKTGNPELARAMSQEVRHMEGVLTDGLRSGLLSQTELHGLASAEARALANMAWKDDAYQSERTRFELELQIQKTMNDKQDEIDAAGVAMRKAIAQIERNFTDIKLSPDELWDLGMEDWFRNAKDSDGNPFSEIVQIELRGLWNSIMDNVPGASLNYDTFKSGMTGFVNERALHELGIYDQVRGIIAMGDDKDALPNEQAFGKMVGRWVATSAPNDFLNQMRTVGGSAYGGGFTFDLDAEARARAALDQTGSLLDLWKEHENFVTNYPQYTNVNGAQVQDNQLSYNSDQSYAYPLAGINWWGLGGFGMIGEKNHEGVDIHAPRGTPVVAATSGFVEKVGWNNVGGWSISIRSAPSPGQPNGYLHYYTHMNSASELQVGQSVQIGSMIGQVGDSGNAQGGATMLHYGIRDSSGRAINPATILKTVIDGSGWAGTRSPTDLRSMTYEPVTSGGTSSGPR